MHPFRRFLGRFVAGIRTFAENLEDFVAEPGPELTPKEHRRQRRAARKQEHAAAKRGRPPGIVQRFRKRLRPTPEKEKVDEGGYAYHLVRGNRGVVQAQYEVNRFADEESALMSYDSLEDAGTPGDAHGIMALAYWPARAVPYVLYIAPTDFQTDEGPRRHRRRRRRS